MIEVTLRCWPNGRVTESFKKTFAVAPAPGDILELTPEAEFAIRERRFAPDGSLMLWLNATGETTSWTTEQILDAWERAAAASGGKRKP